MSSSKKRQKRSQAEQAQWLFRRHKNANLLAEPGMNEFIVVLDHVKSDFNIGKIFRTADAFGAREVHLLGINYFDPTPAKGSFKWVPAKFHEDMATCYAELSSRGYTLFTLDPGQGALLSDVLLPAKSAFILGHEEFGHSFDYQEYRQIQPLRIPQVGRVQSLNVSIAASLVMYEYIRQQSSKV